MYLIEVHSRFARRRCTSIGRRETEMQFDALARQRCGVLREFTSAFQYCRAVPTSQTTNRDCKVRRKVQELSYSTNYSNSSLRL